MKNVCMYCLTVLSVFIPCLLHAQDTANAAVTDTTYWRTFFSAGLNFNQASFSSNWKAGGVNSIAFGSLVRYRADYNRDRISFNNDLELQYGIVKNAGQGLRKTNDRIYLDSKLGYNLSPKWNAFVAVNFQTQFAPGYRYEDDAAGVEQELLISNFFAPAFLTTGIGIEYVPVEYFKIRFSPFSPRLTFVTDETIAVNEPTNYGVPIGDQIRYEWLAMQIQADFDKNLAENLNLKFRYLAFANLETLAFNTIDHRLDAVLTAKITQYLNVSLNGTLLYDIDQDADVQLSQALAIGLLYTVGKDPREKQ